MAKRPKVQCARHYSNNGESPYKFVWTFRKLASVYRCTTNLVMSRFKPSKMIARARYNKPATCSSAQTANSVVVYQWFRRRFTLTSWFTVPNEWNKAAINNHNNNAINYYFRPANVSLTIVSSVRWCILLSLLYFAILLLLLLRPSWIVFWITTKIIDKYQ